MKLATGYRLGVIEGYFGKQWSWQCRHDYAPFMQDHGFTSYFYAPKNDPYLRKQWQSPYPDTELARLVELRQQYRLHQLEFGLGLSPFELYLDFSAANKVLLANKLEQLNQIAPDTLCILFDDMMGDLSNLATVQLEIVEFIRTRSSASRFVFCPTYYSYDPLLNKYFGTAPTHYLDELGKQLPGEIDIFWTGPKIISPAYPVEHLLEVGERLQRLPLLWDNYPVNDAKRLTTRLHIGPFPERNPTELQKLCAGQISNPMNQGYLSQLPLCSLAALYRGEPLQATLAEAAQALCSAELAANLCTDHIRFQQNGLDSFSAEESSAFITRYKQYADQPMAVEVVNWLQGDYTFDPACLT